MEKVTLVMRSVDNTIWCDRGCARGFGLGNWVRKEVDKRMDDGGERHSGEMQASRALRSAEADYCTVVTGAAEGLGMQSLMRHLGLRAQFRLWTDSSAANAIGSRRGLGKSRPVELKY